jgi:hypothetical protein
VDRRCKWFVDVELQFDGALKSLVLASKSLVLIGWSDELLAFSRFAGDWDASKLGEFASRFDRFLSNWLSLSHAMAPRIEVESTIRTLGVVCREPCAQRLAPSDHDVHLYYRRSCGDSSRGFWPGWGRASVGRLVSPELVSASVCGVKRCYNPVRLHQSLGCKSPDQLGGTRGHPFPIRGMDMSTHDEIRTALTSEDCTKGRFDDMVCPSCGGPLKLSVHPDMRQFFIRCASDSTHVGMHGENDAAPEWWKACVSRGWY